MAAGGILPSCTRNRGIRVRISARALRKLSYCNRYHNTYWASGICRREQNMLCISSMCGIIKLVSVRAILSRYENCVAVIASGAVNFRERRADCTALKVYTPGNRCLLPREKYIAALTFPFPRKPSCSRKDMN